MNLRPIGIFFGALLALAGGITAAGGVAVFATIGSDGTVSSGHQTLATSGAAIVTSVADLRRPQAVSDIVGDPRVRMSVDSSKPVFVGVGPAKDVERYLAGASIDEISDFEVDPFKLEHHPRGGSARPQPPGKQAFWVATSTGTDSASLDWKADSGQYRLVVMNADGTRGVRTHGDVSLTIPHTAPIAWSLVGGGLLLALGGVATMLAAGRRTFPASESVASRDDIQGGAPMPSAQPEATLHR